jgi:hypothetical protein
MNIHRRQARNSITAVLKILMLTAVLQFGCHRGPEHTMKGTYLKQGDNTKVLIITDKTIRVGFTSPGSTSALLMTSYYKIVDVKDNVVRLETTSSGKRVDGREVTATLTIQVSQKSLVVDGNDSDFNGVWEPHDFDRKNGE